MAKLTFKNFAKEETIMLMLDVNEKSLAELRNNEDLPYIRVNRNKRVYPVQEVSEWLMSRICSGKGLNNSTA